MPPAACMRGRTRALRIHPESLTNEHRTKKTTTITTPYPSGMNALRSEAKRELGSVRRKIGPL